MTGLGQPIAMTKDDQGVWSVTTDTLKPEIYTYDFRLDGVSVMDPANPARKTAYAGIGNSLLRIPRDLVLDSGTGPHGIVAHHVYHSALIGADRDYYVYTPPNYDPSSKETYPVFFVLHGLGDDAAAWTNVGDANTILDNLINSGKAKPMIMVNTLGYGTPEGPATAMSASMIPTFGRALVEEVLPQVEKQYHVAKNGDSRAIAGLSMGGAESFYIGLNNIDKFAWVGSMSGAYLMWPRANPQPAPAATPGAGRGGRGGPRRMETADFEKNFPNLTAKSAAQLKLLWMACGTDDGLLAVNSSVRRVDEIEGHPLHWKKRFRITPMSGRYGGRISRNWHNSCFRTPVRRSDAGWRNRPRTGERRQREETLMSGALCGVSRSGRSLSTELSNRPRRDRCTQQRQRRQDRAGKRG